MFADRRYRERMVPGRLAAFSLVVLMTVACGGGSAGESATTATTAPPRTEVPDVVVRDVATGGDVNLRALGLPDRPTLYWFWAPH
jgi:hypothetical protein